MLVSKDTKICVNPNDMKFALPITQNPKASRWNIGCVGFPTQNLHVGHIDFMLFVLISFALVTQRETRRETFILMILLLTNCWNMIKLHKK